MLNRAKKKMKKKYILMSVALAIWMFFQYCQQTSFKRAYEQGTMYEQLDALMNTTRYSKDVYDAGYIVDGLHLVMNEKIIDFELASDLFITVYAPTSEGVSLRIVHENNDGITKSIHLDCNKNMKILTATTYLWDDKRTKTETSTITKDTFEQLDLIIEKTQEMLDKVYAQMYDG